MPNETLMTNPYDVEIEVLKILKKQIIDTNISPCILELLFYKRCESIDSIMPEPSICDKHMFEKPAGTARDFLNRKICKHSDLVDSGLAHKKFSFLVLEECDITFHNYLSHYIDESPIDFEIFKSLMFQIIYTIHSIQKIYPQFHHGDLHGDNIMLKFDSDYVFGAGNPKFMTFYIDDEQYNVPYFGMVCKIIDFGFSSIPEEGIRSYISQDLQRMFMHSFNDLLFLFYDIYKIAGLHANVKSFLIEIEPNKTFIHHNVKYIKKIADKIPTAKEMLFHDLFSQYKTDVKPEFVWHEYKK